MESHNSSRCWLYRREVVCLWRHGRFVCYGLHRASLPQILLCWGSFPVGGAVGEGSGIWKVGCWWKECAVGHGGGSWGCLLSALCLSVSLYFLVFLLLWYFPLVPGVRLPFGGHEPIWVLTPLNYTSEVFSPNDLKLICPLSLGKIFPETNYWRRYYIPVLTDNHFNEVWRGILILKFNEAKMYPSPKYFLFFVGIFIL